MTSKLYKEDKNLSEFMENFRHTISDFNWYKYIASMIREVIEC